MVYYITIGFIICLFERMAQKNYLTKEWYEKLLQELNDLKKVQLPGVIERISEARAQWDLSENFDYKAALEDRDLVESRIIEIENLIKDVELIEEKAKWKKQSSVVDYGSTVRIQFEDGKEYKVTIVWSGEVATDKNNVHISLDSPLGSAIRGKATWETCSMRMATGKQSIKILSVN